MPLVRTTVPATVEDSALAKWVRSNIGGTRLFNLAEWQNRALPQVPAPSLEVSSGWVVPTALELDVDATQTRWAVRASRLFWEAVDLDRALMEPLLQRRGVGLVLQHPTRARGDAAERAGADGARTAQVVRVTGALSDVSCAARVVRFEGDAGWIASVRSLGPRVRDAALVEYGDAPPLPGEWSPCTVSEAHVRPGTVVAEVIGAGPQGSFVAVNQTWHPGWTARVDGQSAPVIRTDLDLCAVTVTSGRHHIELLYRDGWVAWSVGVSLAALLVCLALLIPRRRRDGDPGTEETWPVAGDRWSATTRNGRAVG
jgi:hypothetical protein